MKCYLCGVESEQSYFLGVNKGMAASLVEVCPECHHFFCYAEPDILENYKRRKNII